MPAFMRPHPSPPNFRRPCEGRDPAFSLPKLEQVSLRLMRSRSSRAKSRDAGATCLDFARHKRMWVNDSTRLKPALEEAAGPLPSQGRRVDKVAAGERAVARVTKRLFPIAPLLALLLTAPAAAAPPKRIVSLNPCIDAVLMRIVEPRRIAAISHYSHDPRATSIPLSQALRFPVTSGTAEEVLAMRPDLVLAGPHVALSTIHALERQNIRLLRLAVPESVKESKAQITELSTVLNVPQRGRRLNARIDAALAHARPQDKQFVPALIWQGGGMVPGAHTLADELLRRTGFRNMSSVYGLQQWDVLPLEHLLARPPRVLFSAGGAAGDRDRMLSHPAIRRLSHRIAVREYAPRLLHCAGPSMIDAVTRLSEVRRSLKARP